MGRLYTRRAAKARGVYFIILPKLFLAASSQWREGDGG